MNDLVKSLRFQGRFGSETEDEARVRRYHERCDAASRIEVLEAELASLRTAARQAPITGQTAMVGLAPGNPDHDADVTFASVHGYFGRDYVDNPMHFARRMEAVIGARIAKAIARIEADRAVAQMGEGNDAACWREVVRRIGYRETGTATGPIWTVDLPPPSRAGNTDENFRAAITSCIQAEQAAIANA